MVWQHLPAFRILRYVVQESSRMRRPCPGVPVQGQNAQGNCRKLQNRVVGLFAGGVGAHIIQLIQFSDSKDLRMSLGFCGCCQLLPDCRAALESVGRWRCSPSPPESSFLSILSLYPKCSHVGLEIWHLAALAPPGLGSWNRTNIL